ncbi:MAG: hypothetical protein HZC51_02835 [Nitrospirae bacterium]|nr:hypothetical protein [Nitrospirota bacterium]
MADTAYRGSRGDDVDLSEYARVIYRRRFAVAGITFVSMLLGALLGFLLPKVYSATSRVMPPAQDSQSGMAALVSQLPQGLGSFAAPLLGVSASSKAWADILASQNVLDSVIGRFRLMEVYGVDTIEETRKRLQDSMSVEESKGGVISITVDDKDPQLAAELANSLVAELDRVNREMVMSSGTRTRDYLDKLLADSKESLARSEDALRDFQEKNGAVKLDEQSKAVVEAMGAVKGHLIAKEVELATLRSYATNDNPQAGILRAEVEGLRSQLRELEQGGGEDDSGLILPAARFPALTVEYARLYREAKIQDTLYQILVAQHGQAGFQEAKDSSTVQVLDKAPVPTKSSRPRKALILFFATGAGFMFSLLFVLVRERSARSADRA